ncbi:suppressor of fused domain protein [Nocardia thailandica]
MEELSGWAAIDDALRPLYGDTAPTHWGTLIAWRLGGPDPLDGISAYAREEPVPHWHYVSYGMSELGAAQSKSGDPAESGWGFEFTFRLARRPGEQEAPIWPAAFLQNLARYVHESGNRFASGHHLGGLGPFAAEDTESAIRAAAVITDPELGAIGTPNGRVEFLQIVGLTEAEYDAARRWRTRELLRALRPRLPLWVTDPARACLLTDPQIAAEVRAGTTEQGSGLGELFADTVEWTYDGTAAVIRIGAHAAPIVADALADRLGSGNALRLTGSDTAIRFAPAPEPAFRGDTGEFLEIDVPAAAVTPLAEALRCGTATTVPALRNLIVTVD